MRSRSTVLVASVVLLGTSGCGNGSDTPTSDRLDDCLAKIDKSFERTPSEDSAGYGADVEYLARLENKPVAVYVAEGDTDPRAVYQEALRSERDRRRYAAESGQADDPNFTQTDVEQVGDVVLTLDSQLSPAVRRRVEGCAR